MAEMVPGAIGLSGWGRGSSPLSTGHLAWLGTTPTPRAAGSNLRQGRTRGMTTFSAPALRDDPEPTPDAEPVPEAPPTPDDDPFGPPVLYSDRVSTGTTNSWSSDLAFTDKWNRQHTDDHIIRLCGTRRPKQGQVAWYCHSSRRCLLCSRYVLQGYRSALAEATRDVPEVLFMTFTRRNTGASARDEWEALRHIRRRFMKNKFFLFQKERGITGYAVSTEVTRSRDAWHFHLHVLFVLDHELGGAGERQLVRALQERWKASAAYVGEDVLLSRQKGRSVAPGADRAHMAWYVTKQDLEYRGEAHSRTPADLLALGAHGDEAALRDWDEYSGTLRKVPVLERFGSLSRSRNAPSEDDSHESEE